MSRPTEKGTPESRPDSILPVTGIGAPFNLELPRGEEMFRPLSQPLAVRFTVLYGTCSIRRTRELRSYASSDKFVF